MIVRWDLKTGRALDEVPSPIPKAASLRYGESRHVLLDGKVLVHLDTGRTAWTYDGGVPAAGGPGAMQYYVASDEILGPGTLRAASIPEKKAALAESALADPKARALIRDGSKVSIQVVGEPARDAERFRRDLVEGLAGQLRRAGCEVADGQPVRVVVKFESKGPGRTIEFRKFSGGGEPEKRTMQASLLDWELAVADGGGDPIVIARASVPFTSPGLLENIPPGENDWEGYLRARQYTLGTAAAIAYGVPYFVARRPEGGVFLPGRTFLGHPTF